MGFKVSGDGSSMKPELGGEVGESIDDPAT